MTIVVQERGLRRKPGESVHLRDREKNREGRDIQKAGEKDQGKQVYAIWWTARGVEFGQVWGRWSSCAE